MNGIDISQYQTALDLCSSGVDFAILKLSEGRTIPDASFDRHYAQGTAIKLPMGAYVYSHALSTSDAEKEAEYALSLLKGRELPLGVFMDVETAQQMQIAKGQLKETVAAFCRKIEAAGYRSGIYGSEYNLWTRIDPGVWGDTLIWVAHYSKEPEIFCDLWQSSDKGRVPGYSGNVDTDVTRSERVAALIRREEPAAPKVRADPVVMMLQTCMRYDGYWPGEIDGVKSAEFREKIQEYAADVAAC